LTKKSNEYSSFRFINCSIIQVEVTDKSFSQKTYSQYRQIIENISTYFFKETSIKTSGLKVKIRYSNMKILQTIHSTYIHIDFKNTLTIEQCKDILVPTTM